MEKSASAKTELIVHFRASDTFAEELKAVAEENGVSVGRWVKKLVQDSLRQDSNNFDTKFDLSKSLDSDNKKRVSISLTSSELDAINILMKETKISTVSKMIVSIIRAMLVKNPIFSHEELVTLRRATIELQTIGRNINQIAIHYFIGKISEADRLTQKELESLSKNFITYSNYVNKVLVSSYKRYGLTYGK